MTARNASPAMPRSLKANMLVTDWFFIAYWSMTALAAADVIKLPPSLLYSNYTDPMMVAWNWSFFPLDIVLSIVGLTAVRLAGQNDPRWQALAMISLSLTFCAGFMAISFWAITCDFELTWWAANLYFTIWPLFFLAHFFCKLGRETENEVTVPKA